MCPGFVFLELVGFKPIDRKAIRARRRRPSSPARGKVELAKRGDAFRERLQTRRGDPMIDVDKLPEFDAADYLETDEDVAQFLDEACKSQDPQHIAHAKDIAARARARQIWAKTALRDPNPSS